MAASRRAPSGSIAVLHVVHHRIRTLSGFGRSVCSLALCALACSTPSPISVRSPSTNSSPPPPPSSDPHPPFRIYSIYHEFSMHRLCRRIILYSHVFPCMRICLLSVCSQSRRSHPSCSPSAYCGVIILYRGLTAILPISHRSPPCPTLYRAGRHIDVER